MSATVDFELTRDDYPDLFDGVEADYALLIVEADGYRRSGKTSGPYGTGYPAEGDWWLEGERIEGTDEIDAYEAAEAVGFDTIEEKWWSRYG